MTELKKIIETDNSTNCGNWNGKDNNIFEFLENENLILLTEKEHKKIFNFRDLEISLSNKLREDFWDEDEVLRKKISQIKGKSYLIFSSYSFCFKNSEQLFNYMEKFDTFSKEPFLISQDGTKQIKFHHEYLWGSNF